MRSVPLSVILVGQALILSGASPGAQSRAAKVFARCNKPLESARVDLATGTVSRGPTIRNRGATTVVDFANNDLSGFVGVDTGNGFCEWFDAGVKGFAGGSSDLMGSVTFAYCSAKRDPQAGGPGGSVRLGFYEGYTTGGGAPSTAVATFTLTGLPAHSASSSFSSGFSCYFLRVDFDAPVAFADGPIGYSWRFVDAGIDGVLAGTFPFLSCVASCSGAQSVDGQGMTNRMDRYCPPGTLRSTFTFGTTSGSFTSMSMAIEEKKADPKPGLEDIPEKVRIAVSCANAGNGHEELTDIDFAKALKKELKDNAFHSLVVCFSPCYAAGFVKQVYEVFGNDITKPVFAMSPVRYDQKSKTTNKWEQKEGAKYGVESLWSRWYWKHHDGVRTTPPPLINANYKEKRIWDLTKKEILVSLSMPNPQYFELNGGNDIRLGKGENKTFATKFRALVVDYGEAHPPEGVANIKDAWNTMGRQFAGLKASEFPVNRMRFLFAEGSAPSDTVTTGDKAPSIHALASRNEILKGIQELDPDASTQIYIYLGMHGMTLKVGALLLRPSDQVVASNTIQFPALEAFELAGLSSPSNSTGPLLRLKVSGVGGELIPPGYGIYFNGMPVIPEGGATPSIPGGSLRTELVIPIPSSYVNSGGNTVWLPSADPGAPPVSVIGSFTTGAMAPQYTRPLGISGPGG